VDIKKASLTGLANVDLLWKTICCIAAVKLVHRGACVHRKRHEMPHYWYELHQHFPETLILPHRFPALFSMNTFNLAI